MKGVLLCTYVYIHIYVHWLTPFSNKFPFMEPNDTRLVSRTWVPASLTISLSIFYQFLYLFLPLSFETYELFCHFIGETMRRRFDAWLSKRSKRIYRNAASRIVAWERDGTAVCTREQIRGVKNRIRTLVGRTSGALQFFLCSRLYAKATCGRSLFSGSFEPLSPLEASNNTYFTLPWQAGCDRDYANN